MVRCWKLTNTMVERFRHLMVVVPSDVLLIERRHRPESWNFWLLSDSMLFQHCIDICHTSSRRPFTNSQICIYIDGHLKLTQQLKFPALTEVSLLFFKVLIRNETRNSDLNLRLVFTSFIRLPFWVFKSTEQLWRADRLPLLFYI